MYSYHVERIHRENSQERLQVLGSLKWKLVAVWPHNSSEADYIFLADGITPSPQPVAEDKTPVAEIKKVPPKFDFKGKK